MGPVSKTYPSKITYWLYVPAAFLIAAFLIFSIIKVEYIGIVVLSVTGGLIVFPILFYTRYTISDTSLNVRSGLIININVEINNIKKIVPTDSILSAPALSSDRIEIFYNTYDNVIISPKNKKDFIETLKQINPTIVSEV
jgi:Bacterial PH domain